MDPVAEMFDVSSSPPVQWRMLVRRRTLVSCSIFGITYQLCGLEQTFIGYIWLRRRRWSGTLLSRSDWPARWGSRRRSRRLTERSNRWRSWPTTPRLKGLDTWIKGTWHRIAHIGIRHSGPWGRGRRRSRKSIIRPSVPALWKAADHSI
jgi:hypothetical protein